MAGNVDVRQCRKDLEELVTEVRCVICTSYHNLDSMKAMKCCRTAVHFECLESWFSTYPKGEGNDTVLNPQCMNCRHEYRKTELRKAVKPLVLSPFDTLISKIEAALSNYEKLLPEAPSAAAAPQTYRDKLIPSMAPASLYEFSEMKPYVFARWTSTAVDDDVVPDGNYYPARVLEERNNGYVIQWMDKETYRPFVLKTDVLALEQVCKPGIVLCGLNPYDRTSYIHVEILKLPVCNGKQNFSIILTRPLEHPTLEYLHSFSEFLLTQDQASQIG